MRLRVDATCGGAVKAADREQRDCQNNTCCPVDPESFDEIQTKNQAGQDGREKAGDAAEH